MVEASNRRQEHTVNGDEPRSGGEPKQPATSKTEATADILRQNKRNTTTVRPYSPTTTPEVIKNEPQSSEIVGKQSTVRETTEKAV